MNRSWRVGTLLLLLLTVAAVTVVAVLAPLAQPLSYHGFADQRAFFGIPNFLNVASSLALLGVGAFGLLVLRQSGGAVFIQPGERWPYGLFFLALAGTGLGSAWYHLAPDNAGLFWDRLPMSVGFTALLAAMLVERLSVRVGLRLLAPLVLSGAATVVYWRYSAALGTENMLPYMVLQAYSLLGVLLLIGCFAPRYNCGAYLLAGVALYGAALCAQWLDHPLFALAQVASGHTVKHLLVALAAYLVIRMLRTRSALGRPG